MDKEVIEKVIENWFVNNLKMNYTYLDEKTEIQKTFEKYLHDYIKRNLKVKVETTTSRRGTFGESHARSVEVTVNLDNEIIWDSTGYF